MNKDMNKELANAEKNTRSELRKLVHNHLAEIPTDNISVGYSYSGGDEKGAEIITISFAANSPLPSSNQAEKLRVALMKNHPDADIRVITSPAHLPLPLDESISTWIESLENREKPPQTTIDSGKASLETQPSKSLKSASV